MTMFMGTFTCSIFACSIFFTCKFSFIDIR